MDTIKILAPAKINLDLKVGKKRSDGFHPIKSFMQSISLFDIVTLKKIKKGLVISGTSDEIPYNNENLAWKAAELFFNHAGMTFEDVGISIFIEKNIPVCAGLAGGSTDAAAVLFGLNKMFNEKLSFNVLHKICTMLGSDLNFCLEGGAKICKGKGEILKTADFKQMPITIVKPLDLKISAKEAYQKFDMLCKNSTMLNDLEFALLPHYKELQYLHSLNFQMSGSGPSFFLKTSFLDNKLKDELKTNHLIIENLKTINYGVRAL